MRTELNNHKIRRLKVVAAACISLIMSVSTTAKTQEVDHLGLAALLISDGNLNRAESLLSDLENPNKVAEEVKLDYAQYHLLKGLLAFKMGDYESAEVQYELSIEQGQNDKLIHIYLAQTHYALNEFQLSLIDIENSKEVGQAMASVFSLKAQCNWKLAEYDSAWAALDEGAKQFPSETRFDRQKIYYLIEKGLYQTAIDLAKSYLAGNEQKSGMVKEYIALGRALRESGQMSLATEVLEKAKLMYPKSVPVATELAHVYLKKEQILTASDIFAQAFILEPKLAADTAELYRQAGRLYRALNINSEISDQKSKMKQRLAILVELNDFESVAAMGSALERLGLYANQDILYAHAYSLYRTGDFMQARVQLSGLTRSDLFRKATELRSAMEKCEGATWRCF
jgi:tetratricopeptide (TPR) repeat protein